jgi:hypothetical protein
MSSAGHQPATLWDGLVAVAVLGTERRPYQVGPTSAAATVATDVGAGAGDYLAGVSALWAAREAGRRPLAPTVPSPPPAPDDPRPPLPVGAVSALGTVLTDRRFRAVLPEWLELAVSHGGRLPAEMVPVLLGSGTDERAPARAATGAGERA